MKIAIINLTGGGMSEGYRKYLLNILPRMAVNPAVEALLCASPDYVNIKDLFKPPANVKLINCKPYRLFGYENNAELVCCLKEFSGDVLFVPTERFFRFAETPVVNMIQNMEPFVSGINGNPISERLKILVKAIDGRRTIKKADRVIAISRFVRDFLVQNWKIQPKKIGLVYHGVDLPENKDFHRPDIIPKGWDGQFLFSAGSIRPARGLEDALYALNYLFDKSSNISGLVIAGETTSVMMRYKKNLEDWIKTYKLSSKVCWVGNLNENEMAWCYKNCKAFVMTSRAEACPNIVLEAMAHGCLCISTETPPMPEFFRDVALYYPPKNGKALADALIESLSWKDEKKRIMQERAKQRASQFSWDICAERTVEQLLLAVDEFITRGKNK
jgi:glycosyltransferase involved in cell wall biosynthesis